MKKETFLESLKEAKSKLNTAENGVLERKTLLEGLSCLGKSTDEKMDEIIAKVQNFKGDAIQESEWKPQRTDIKELTRKILTEAEITNGSQNAFRINLMPIVVDVGHAKFQATRNGKTATIEILYPNANEKITVKVQVEGAEDKLVEVGLDEPEYTQSLGAYIIRLIDEGVGKSDETQQQDVNDYMQSADYFQNSQQGSMGKGSFPPNWAAMGESDRRKMDTLITLVEQKEDDGELDLEDFGNDIKDGAEEADVDAGDVEGVGDIEGGGDGGDFTEDDFSEGGGGGGFDDFSGGGGFDDLGGGGEGDPADVNEEEGGMPGQAEEDQMYFGDKTDWSIDSIKSMQSMVADTISKSGAEQRLTSDEVLNGTSGIQGMTNHDIIEAFLTPKGKERELASILFTASQLDEIEKKLEMNDGQFDAFIEKHMAEYTEEHDQEVTDVLDSGAMFDDTALMGGEAEVPVGEDEFDMSDEFTDDLVGKAKSEMDEEDTTTPDELEAESEIGGTEVDEFAGLGEDDPEKKK